MGTCCRPITAWRPDEGGRLHFYERRNSREITIPCGQCIECKLERSRQWAVRCMHESSLHDFSSFVTLTYRDSNAVGASLCYSDYQLFMKRLRSSEARLASGTEALPNTARRESARAGRIRFVVSGEYGETYFRPHFHALLFGKSFPDRYPWRKSSAGFQLYRSAELDYLWPHGNAEIGDVTFESAAYVARYCVQKVTGEMAEAHYTRIRPDGTSHVVEPEFLRMSLKPGIGADWFRMYRSEVFPGDGTSGVVVNGMKVRPPRYYEKLADGWLDDATELDVVKHERYKESLLRRDDCTPERLAVRETVTRARLSFKKRSLE